MQKTSAASACVGKPKVRKPRKSKHPKQERAADKEPDEQPDDKKRQTPAMLYKDICDATGLEMNVVRKVVDALFGIISTKLREDGKFTLPNIVLFRLKDTTARPATIKKLFDKEIQIAAKPPGKRVHPLVLKPLKRAVIESSE